jgi:hypothetical protein
VTRRPSFSDIDLTRWREYDDVLTDSLWLFDSRDKGGGHQLDYHGNYIPQIATQVYTRYTRREETVLDLFLGSGTSAIEAVRLGRRCIGVELKPELVASVRAKLPAALEDQIQVLEGDSTQVETAERVRRALGAWKQTHAQLVVLHPPYHDIIHFSDRAEDLSNAPDTESFLEGFAAVARNAYALLDEGRFACLIVGDKYARGELIPLGFLCMQKMNDVGFRTKAIVVKDIQGNERGKGRSENLWRYRALAGGFYLFKHEYVIVFQKPAAPVDVRGELLKVREMLPWGRVQDDEWDRLSRYVYRTETLSALRRRTRQVVSQAGLPLNEFAAYVLRRWYNFQTHNAVLDVILAHPRTRPEPDPFHHTVDFYLLDASSGDERGFDLKLSDYPRGYGHDLAYARTHVEDLARWLYGRQSQQGRYHAANRLFVVLHDARDPERTWELRRDFERLERLIRVFLDRPRLMRIEVTDGADRRSGGARRWPWVGVIFCVRE